MRKNVWACLVLRQQLFHLDITSEIPQREEARYASALCSRFNSGVTSFFAAGAYAMWCDLN